MIKRNFDSVHITQDIPMNRQEKLVGIKPALPTFIAISDRLFAVA